MPALRSKPKRKRRRVGGYLQPGLSQAFPAQGDLRYHAKAKRTSTKHPDYKKGPPFTYRIKSTETNWTGTATRKSDWHRFAKYLETLGYKLTDSQVVVHQSGKPLSQSEATKLNNFTLQNVKLPYGPQKRPKK